MPRGLVPGRCRSDRLPTARRAASACKVAPRNSRAPREPSRPSPASLLARTAPPACTVAWALSVGVAAARASSARHGRRCSSVPCWTLWRREGAGGRRLFRHVCQGLLQAGSMSAKAAPCAPGSYGNTTGLMSQKDCHACPAGASCLLGATLPTPCASGTFAENASAGECTPCVAGSFQSKKGGTACDTCSAGGYCPSGASQGQPCAAGSFGNSTGLTSSWLHACPPGHACSLAQERPRRVRAGTVAPNGALASALRVRREDTRAPSEQLRARRALVGAIACGRGVAVALPCRHLFKHHGHQQGERLRGLPSWRVLRHRRQVA